MPGDGRSIQPFRARTLLPPLGKLPLPLRDSAVFAFQVRLQLFEDPRQVQRDVRRGGQHLGKRHDDAGLGQFVPILDVDLGAAVAAKTR